MKTLFMSVIRAENKMKRLMEKDAEIRKKIKEIEKKGAYLEQLPKRKRGNRPENN